MSDDRLTPPELQDMFVSAEAKAKALYIRQRDELARLVQSQVKSDMISLNESARLKFAKQEQFDFAKPGPDWGSTTWKRRK